jgi:hypothetical protein
MQARRRIYTKYKVCLERTDGHETLRAKRDPYACYSYGGEGQIIRYWSVRILLHTRHHGEIPTEPQKSLIARKDSMYARMS